MKAIRWIQNVAAVVAIAMAVSLADGIGITSIEPFQTAWFSGYIF
ncbi:hypothetical protein [Bacteroides faecis]|nr:hypothetical protein [Bacteroides faecis]MDC7981221.1 hypothetical protein [Bacteroides faecis]